MSTFGVSTCLARRFEEGFEFYTFEVARSGLERSASLGRVNEFLCSMYLEPARPHPREIVGSKIEGVDSQKVRVTVQIRRGHLLFLELVKNHIFHGGFTTQLTGRYLAIVCSCGHAEVLDARSII